jgi:uncharacterized protein
MPTAAIIGASNLRQKYGNKALRAFRDQGYDVYPVNRRGGDVEGETAYTSVQEIPVDLDVVTIYLPPPLTLDVLEDVAEKGVNETVFVNPGAGDMAVTQRGRELGLPLKNACSIIAIGTSPGRYP